MTLYAYYHVAKKTINSKSITYKQAGNIRLLALYKGILIICYSVRVNDARF